jgi:hypothetical protein
MSGLVGRHEEVFVLPGSPAAVQAHFSNLDVLVAATERLARSEQQGDGVVRFVLQPQGVAGFGFTPDYRVRWTTVGAEVRWEPVQPSNLLNRGAARFEAAPGGGTRVTWWQEITIQAQIPRLMMSVVQPVLDRTLVPSLRAYLATLRAGAPTT